jgi:hypothetical protein
MMPHIVHHSRNSAQILSVRSLPAIPHLSLGKNPPLHDHCSPP